MAIVPADILFFLTGGGANADPNASLGGGISNTQVPAGLHNIFDRVSPEEALAGDTEYRAIDVKNSNVTDTAFDAFLWISQETVSDDTSVSLAYDATGTQVIANESTPPVGVAFTTPISKLTGINLGNIAPLQTRRIWLRRTVTAGAEVANDSGSLTVGCSTGV